MTSLDTPLVSILIPCYNAERFVAEAVESALNQTHANIEVIVVDDGSTDRSVEVLRSFGDRIRLEIGPNRGGCAARNRALELSRGEFVQFLDSDDLLLPTKIEELMPYLVEDKADMVWCGGFIFQDGGIEIPQEGGYPDPADSDSFVYLLEFPLQTSLPLHRRRFLEAVGSFRPGLPRAQEWDLHVRLGAIGIRLRQINKRLVHLRRHEGPRVSTEKRGPDYNLKLLITLAQELEAAGQLQSAVRRKALATQITLFSIYSHRSHERELARKGFRVARQLASISYPDERCWVRSIAAVVGPAGTERILDWGRRVLCRR